MNDSLKSQDIVVLLGKVASPSSSNTFESLGNDLLLSASQVHRSVTRCVQAGLATKDQSGSWNVLIDPLFEFLVHGVKYAFYPVQGAPRRGIATGVGVEPLRSELLLAEDQISVWAHPEGDRRGPSLEPLCKSAPDAARRNPDLHVLLSLVDALRIGRSRERALAENFLRMKLY